MKETYETPKIEIIEFGADEIWTSDGAVTTGVE